MLAEKRHMMILSHLARNNSATVSELCDLLDISEATLRRDLNELHKQGMLNKVRGGATVVEGAYHTEDPAAIRDDFYNTQKAAIAQEAAKLVQENDFVYIDAGTTTCMMIEHLTVRRATFITNGLPAARRLAQRGYNTFILAGQVRATAGAVVGAEAMGCLARYSFNIGFFGANGISIEKGYTNTDVNEARTKMEAMFRCEKRYVLADARKFGRTLPITFANLSDAVLITSRVPDLEYFKYARIIQTSQ